MSFTNNFIRHLKNKNRVIDLCNISGQHIADYQVASYIIFLKKTEPFSYLHMGYRYEKQEEEFRFIILALDPNIQQIQYFKDRCPAMIEEKIKTMDCIPFKSVKWEKINFEEIIPVDYITIKGDKL